MPFHKGCNFWLEQNSPHRVPWVESHVSWRVDFVILEGYSLDPNREKIIWNAGLSHPDDPVCIPGYTHIGIVREDFAQSCDCVTCNLVDWPEVWEIKPGVAAAPIFQRSRCVSATERCHHQRQPIFGTDTCSIRSLAARPANEQHDRD